MANSFIYKDLAFQPKLNAQGDVEYVTDIEAIKQSITQILNTRPGERVMRPKFGSGVNTVLFALMDNFTEDRLRDAVVNAIQQWDTRVIVRDVQIINEPDDNAFNIRLFLDLVGLSISESISLDIEITK